MEKTYRKNHTELLRRLLMAVQRRNICRFRTSVANALILTTLLFSACKGGGQEKKTIPAELPEVSAPGLLFNGTNLEGWEITTFGPQGAVYVSGGSIILGMGDGCTGITWKKEFPSDNYEVTLEAKRIQGTDFFCGMTFTVGKSPCTLVVGGWGGTLVGLSSINGRDASENETRTLRKFEKDQWYAIRLRVAEGSIKAWIDDEMVVDFTIGGKQLSVRPEVELSRPFGIASWVTTAAIRNIRVERI
jgi:hypothetical protein